MTFAGILAFFDPAKPGIVDLLAELRDLGVATRIITGDSRRFAAHVAAAIGLGGSLMTGAELRHTRDEALWHLAEVDLQAKERIARALQARGHAVIYLGDDINDAPALRTADVGVSVDQVVDVARDCADIVLMERDLEVLRQGIVDGRRTFAKTLRYITITTSANYGNMVSMALGAVVLPFLPLTAAQTQLGHLLTDIPALSFAGDRVDPERVERAPRWDIPAIRWAPWASRPSRILIGSSLAVALATLVLPWLGSTVPPLDFA